MLGKWSYSSAHYAIVTPLTPLFLEELSVIYLMSIFFGTFRRLVLPESEILHQLST